MKVNEVCSRINRLLSAVLLLIGAAFLFDITSALSSAYVYPYSNPYIQYIQLGEVTAVVLILMAIVLIIKVLVPDWELAKKQTTIASSTEESKKEEKN